MIKGILIEDRIHRQKNYLGERVDELSNFPFLTNISGGHSFATIRHNLINNEYFVLNEYSLIMIHRSAFETSTRNGLIDYLRKTDKKIVFFSGGISGCQISKIGDLQFLLINVSQFYSENLILFLKHEAQSLLELAFGNDWRISILADVFNKLVLYSKSFTPKPWPNVEVDLKLNSWIKEDYFSDLAQKDFVNKADLERVWKKMKIDLKKLIQ